MARGGATLSDAFTWDDAISPVLGVSSSPNIYETNMVADPCVRRMPGGNSGWRMDYFGSGPGTARDFYATTTDAAFPGGWVRQSSSNGILQPGSAGTYDELYAH